MRLMKFDKRIQKIYYEILKIIIQEVLKVYGN